MKLASLGLICAIGCAAHRPAAAGTCFFVSASGLALTSLHVIGTGSRIYVIDSTGRSARAQVVARDLGLDLAEVQSELDVPGVLRVAGGDAVLGDRVFAIRAELRDKKIFEALIEGLVVEQRALGADFLLAISAHAERGTSGGPLVNDRGEVVGVMIRSTGDGAGAAAKLSFAVKASSARNAFAALPAARDSSFPDRTGAIELARRASCTVYAR